MKKTILISIMVIVSIITNAQTATFPSLGKMKRQAEKGNPEAELQLADYYYSIESYVDATIYYLKASNSDIPKAQFMVGLLKEKGIDIKFNGFWNEREQNNAINYNNQNYSYWYNLAKNKGYTRQNYLSDLANKGSDTQEDYRNDFAFQEKTNTKRTKNIAKEAKYIAKEDARRKKIESDRAEREYDRENGIVHSSFLHILAQGMVESSKTFNQQIKEYDAGSRGTTVAAENAKAQRDAAFYAIVEQNSNSNSSSNRSNLNNSSSNNDSNSSNSSSGNTSSGKSSDNSSTTTNNKSEPTKEKFYDAVLNEKSNGWGKTEAAACEAAEKFTKNWTPNGAYKQIKDISSCKCKDLSAESNYPNFICTVTYSLVYHGTIPPGKSGPTNTIAK